MKLILFAHLLIFARFLCTTNAARILGIFSFAARSHFNYNHAIMRSLHAAGHQITMATPFTYSEERIENFTHINLSSEESVFVGRTPLSDLAAVTFAQNMDWLIATCMPYCYRVMKLPQIQEAMKSPVKLYDIMFIELLAEYPCYLPIAQKLGIPVIGTMTMHFWPFADHAIGAPRNPNLSPIGFGTSTPPFNLIGRVKNLWYHLTTLYYRPKLDKEIDKFYRGHVPNELVAKKDVSLVFYNSHPTIMSRPIPANLIEIGGIHVNLETKPLPKKLQTFIDEAPHGVILFSLGSFVRTSSITRAQKEAFVAAFASIPQRVIWKFEEPIENLPKNVMILEWLPQKDILKHKNVIAFMSHCGQSGMYEAIVTGTPVVTIPFCFDQYINAATLQQLGVGVGLQLDTVTKDTVLIALDAIIYDKSYHRRSQELSRRFMDRPITPEKSVVYWTEYVLKHNGAPHLKSLGSDMPFYQYFLLDIIALALLALGSTVLAIYCITRKIFSVSVANKGKISTKKRN